MSTSPQRRDSAALRDFLQLSSPAETRAVAALLAAGAALVALSLALPHPDTTHTSVLIDLAGLMAAGGLLFVALARYVRGWMVHAALAVVAAIVNLLIYESGVAAGQFTSIFVWSVLLTAYFFPRRVAFAHLLWILGGNAVVLSAVAQTAGYSPFTRWILMAASLSVVSALTTSLVARRSQADAKAKRFFDLSHDMLCTADTNGYFVDLNSAWERTLGYTEEELRAQPFVELVHPEDRERTNREAAAIFEGNVTVDFENRYLAKGGSVHWLRWSAVLGDDGMIYARATDVTRRKAAEQELSQTAEALDRSNADLRRFASVAAHDLGEPLRTIAGFAQLLEKRYEDQVDEQGRDYIRRMVGGVGRMQTLIRDLLAFSRAGRDEVDLKPVDCTELVEEIKLDLNEAIDEKHAEIRVHELPTVRGDRNQLHQVFQNLLSNGLKFQNGARPRVEVSAQKVEDGWRFSVADNGIGIEPEYREKIFNAFERLHGRDDYAGTGIGLAICQRIVQLHGGQIQVEDGLDGGSSFVFTIADEKAEEA